MVGDDVVETSLPRYQHGVITVIRIANMLVLPAGLEPAYLRIMSSLHSPILLREQ